MSLTLIKASDSAVHLQQNRYERLGDMSGVISPNLSQGEGSEDLAPSQDLERLRTSLGTDRAVDDLVDDDAADIDLVAPKPILELKGFIQRQRLRQAHNHGLRLGRVAQARPAIAVRRWHS